MNNESIAGVPSRTLPEKLVVALAFLIPVFAIPIVWVPFQATKVLLASGIVAFLLILWAIRAVKTKTLPFSVSPVGVSLGILVASYFFSSLFSGNPGGSFIGYQIDSDTFAFILLCSLTALTVGWAAHTARAAFLTLCGLLAAVWVVFAFQLVQVGLAAFNLPVFDSAIVNILGKWNDFALFSSLVASLSLITLALMAHAPLQRLAMIATLATAVFFVTLANLSLAWILLGSVAGVVLVTSLAQEGSSGAVSRHSRTSAIIAGIVLALSVLFLFFGSSIAPALQNVFRIQALEVRPSFEGTLAVAEAVYATDALFGSGPNTFSDQWFLHRPDGIVATPFWNVAFSSGFGFIPTSFVTGGIVTGIAWTIFIGAFLYSFARRIFSLEQHEQGILFLLAIAGTGAVLLIAIHLFYVPSPSMSVLMFLFVGLCMALFRRERNVSAHATESSARAALKSVTAILIAVAAIVALVFVLRVYAGGVLYERSVTFFNTNDIDRAEANAARALSFSANDRVYRLLTLTNLSRLSALASAENTESGQEEFRSLLAGTITLGKKALDYNEHNFLNWMSLAGVYGAIAPLKIQGAYEAAVDTYAEVRKRNPRTPEVDYRIAQIEEAQGNVDAARSSVAAALALKQDYTPAILLAGQLALNEGDIDEAIDSLEAALVFEPNNALLVYQYGILHIANESFDEARVAFERALEIDPNYANAKFFLAETYVFLGRPEDALTLINELLVENPNDENLKTVQRAISRGENPFSSEQPLPEEPEGE